MRSRIHRRAATRDRLRAPSRPARARPLRSRWIRQRTQRRYGPTKSFRSSNETLIRRAAPPLAPHRGANCCGISRARTPRAGRRDGAPARVKSAAASALRWVAVGFLPRRSCSAGAAWCCNFLRSRRRRPAPALPSSVRTAPVSPGERQRYDRRFDRWCFIRVAPPPPPHNGAAARRMRRGGCALHARDVASRKHGTASSTLESRKGGEPLGPRHDGRRLRVGMGPIDSKPGPHPALVAVTGEFIGEENGRRGFA